MGNGVPERESHPQFALMVSSSKGMEGQAIYSDPDEGFVQFDANEKNQRAQARGKTTHYWVQRRDAVNVRI